MRKTIFIFYIIIFNNKILQIKDLTLKLVINSLTYNDHANVMSSYLRTRHSVRLQKFDLVVSVSILYICIL